MDMDAYIFNADLWCEDCAKDIIKQLEADGREDDGDSSYWPQGPYSDGGGEADGPQHCGSGEHCLYAKKLKWRGKSVGAIGAFLENPLTSDGVMYLVEMVAERGKSDYQKALHKLWLDFYKPDYPTISKHIAEHNRR